ncbi:vWA domain-containing protein [Deinococcus yavapaiensis]|uniref:Putative metal-dependent peptidase n=1 Tax=Deinococcus yavapaiensis KR-236 TaxID=694435 RepID=A0A318S7W5_9DEIO|nr:VWA-like domain-containing protein [Deinococcus yavapaiensis]PYE53126.1 putative metal-dependent peptidase [Deinococcus yavapaiensis KR-236]
MTRALETRLQRAVILLRARHPFFGVLALHAEPSAAERVADRAVPTACTDGRRVYVNPRFAETITDDELTGVLVHEVLHAALRHVPRSAGREPTRWNVAADVIVNGIVVRDGHRLPKGTVRREDLEHLSVEEVYELLPSAPGRLRLPDEARDLFDRADEASVDEAADLQAFWRGALQNAAVTARLQGELSVGAARALTSSEPSVDWTSALWRFLTPSRDDFGDFDRRHVHRGLYVEDLESHDLRVALCVDTSGSVTPAHLARFLGEVCGILGSYPHVRAELYYADVTLHGPYDPDREDVLPTPRGGGGTDFRPFFDVTTGATLRVYLTDGHGTFPPTEPSGETLWAVPPGGKLDHEFPFGRVLRLV